MSDLLEEISRCVELGKINKASPYPPEMNGQKGADELTREALDKGLSASDILYTALMPGMERIGQKFAENKVFVPQMLMSAKSMITAMEQFETIFSIG
jgi:methanogenic corrinoid protein MtbC1